MILLHFLHINGTTCMNEIRTKKILGETQNSSMSVYLELRFRPYY